MQLRAVGLNYSGLIGATPFCESRASTVLGRLAAGSSAAGGSVAACLTGSVRDSILSSVVVVVVVGMFHVQGFLFLAGHVAACGDSIDKIIVSHVTENIQPQP
jgi:hypothetical protein